MRIRHAPVLSGPLPKRALGYGALLGLGTVVLQWLDYRHLARSYSTGIYVFLVALAFLVIGVLVGARLFRGQATAPRPAGNPRAVESLGISPRELDVLHELAAGRSNKEIAQQLSVSPNTIKTHVAQLLQKLQANRRTDALRKARELGILD
jgi:DNA-binding CsgD family transcriptional regulator